MRFAQHPAPVGADGQQAVHMGGVAVQAIAEGGLGLARPGSADSRGAGWKAARGASRGSVPGSRSSKAGRAAETPPISPRGRWAGHPPRRTMCRRSARARGCASTRMTCGSGSAARDRPGQGSAGSRADDAPMPGRRRSRAAMSAPASATARAHRSGAGSAQRLHFGQRAVDAGASPAPGRLAPSDSTRRQPRAPGRPVNRPSMCRVIWCSRPPAVEVARDIGAHRLDHLDGVARPARRPRAHPPRSATEPGS